MKFSFARKISLTAGLLIVLSMAVLYIMFRSENVESQENRYTKQQLYPTVFVHGYKGTFNSFKTMMDRFENEYSWGNRTLIVYVSKFGELNFIGRVPTPPSEPVFVQVVFENNRATLGDTSKWLTSVMVEIKQRYYVETVNLVGHSMGGLVITHYLKENANSMAIPKTHKLITIGSPFLGIEKESYHKVNTGAAVNDLRPNSNALLKLIRESSEFPKNVQSLVIAGTGDQVVGVNSARGLKQIVPPENYHEKIIDDPSIGHSGLHETLKVDRLINDFLWGFK
ncbi:putative alpha/beta hydrolase family protein [Bacillus pakistanensis]|uniref:Alpha/beta hydrolase family protein n=1 Tax=Rossellomorea pakistanensis TaxID=992288 RepID=A0ABS2N8A0_9BACI|nr:alpha/beta hydrolase [Bacillus pakistanensis]MBM7584063.1 putative alpha/beta hydrolase family protein [Bacillus pakistanensis]